MRSENVEKSWCMISLSGSGRVKKNLQGELWVMNQLHRYYRLESVVKISELHPHSSTALSSEFCVQSTTSQSIIMPRIYTAYFNIGIASHVEYNSKIVTLNSYESPFYNSFCSYIGHVSHNENQFTPIEINFQLLDVNI